MIDKIDHALWVLSDDSIPAIDRITGVLSESVFTERFLWGIAWRFYDAMCSRYKPLPRQKAHTRQCLSVLRNHAYGSGNQEALVVLWKGRSAGQVARLLAVTLCDWAGWGPTMEQGYQIDYLRQQLCFLKTPVLDGVAHHAWPAVVG